MTKKKKQTFTKTHKSLFILIPKIEGKSFEECVNESDYDVYALMDYLNHNEKMPKTWATFDNYIDECDFSYLINLDIQITEPYDPEK